MSDYAYTHDGNLLRLGAALNGCREPGDFHLLSEEVGRFLREELAVARADKAEPRETLARLEADLEFAENNAAIDWSIFPMIDDWASEAEKWARR